MHMEIGQQPPMNWQSNKYSLHCGNYIIHIIMIDKIIYLCYFISDLVRTPPTDAIGADIPPIH